MIETILVFLISTTCEMAVNLLWVAALLNVRITRRECFGGMTIGVFFTLASQLTLGRNHPFYPLSIALLSLLWCIWPLKKRGLGLLLSWIAAIAAGVLMDLCTGWLIMAVMPMERAVLYRGSFTWARLLITLCAVVVCLLLALTARLFWRYYEGRSRALPPWMHVVRPVLLAVSTVAVAVLTEQRLTELGQGVGMSEYIMSNVSMVLLLAVSATYLVQDLRYFRMRRRNETLEQQQQINDALLSEMRVFRHNIINMIYGFEGEVISGDAARISRCYETLAEDCARINNENILSLQKLNQPALSALLLRKIQRAQELDVPFYLNLDATPRWHSSLPDTDLCQIMGVLLDNAIEAAKGSADARVSVFVRQTEAGDVEISLLNTFTEGCNVEGLLRGEPATTRTGHMGVGLKSVQGLLKRHPRVVLNSFVRGRYVEQQLRLS